MATQTLLTHYRQKVSPALQSELKLTHPLAVPTVEKIIVNVSFGKHLKDSGFQENAVKTITRVTGQQPIMTKAKKSISAFKLREGTVIGAKVTLRGRRMWEFLEKLIRVTLPRVRDFHGLDPKGFGRGRSITIGITEHTAFPEIRSDEVENIHGLEITIVTTARNAAAAEALLRHLGLPLISVK